MRSNGLVPRRNLAAFAGWGFAPPPKRRASRGGWAKTPASVRALLEAPALLGVSEPVLVADLRARFGISRTAAYSAVKVARSSVQGREL